MIRLDIQNFCKECANREICKWVSKIDEENLKSCQDLRVRSIALMGEWFTDSLGNQRARFRELDFTNISEDDPHFEFIMKCNRFQPS